jgi:sialate O-acetylesterase
MLGQAIPNGGLPLMIEHKGPSMLFLHNPSARLLVLAALFASPAVADVRVAKVFTDHMVLQRKVSAPVWGWADPAEQVHVRFGDQHKKVTADASGAWRVKLDPLKASAEGRQLSVSGNNTLAFNDVLVGDVWICSGQSNMEWPMRSIMNSAEEIAAANYPTIRLFDVPGHTTAPVAQVDVPGGNWQVCTPKSVGGFSAVGYFFGRNLNQGSGVPVGLIGSNWGGTRIEPWIPPVGFRGVAELKDIADRVNRFDPTMPEGKATWAAHLRTTENWTSTARQAIKAGFSIPKAPSTPGPTGAGEPTAIYNSMLHGLAPYAMAGAIWYQGESNGGEGVEYYHKMRALIEGWRSVWQQDEHPIYFYFVQLANFQQPTDDPAGGDGWSRLREAQRQSLTIEHTGMAVITDIGQDNDIHPRNKQDVGARLARWALRDVAGKDLVVSGPLYQGHSVEGNRIRLRFDYAGKGLMVGLKEGLEPTRNDAGVPLKRFAIAGEDRVWHWAEARIDGKTLLVSCPEVKSPLAVRYAYSMNPVGANLYNVDGLPASPFRTDDW